MLRWHLLTCNFFYLQYWDGTFSPAIFSCSIGMAPSHLQVFLPPDLRWHLLTLDFFFPADLRWHLLTLNFFLPAALGWHLRTCKFFTCRFGMAPSHLQFFYGQICDGTFSPWKYFSGRFAMAPCHFEKKITGKLAMASSHLEVFFSGRIFHMQFWDGTVQGCQIHRKKNQWNHGGFAITSIRLPLKMQNSRKTKMINGTMV